MLTLPVAILSQQVVAELSRGRKRTHWMWFIFPQIPGVSPEDICPSEFFSVCPEPNMRNTERDAHCPLVVFTTPGTKERQDEFGLGDQNGDRR
jgi:hypothetical protein